MRKHTKTFGMPHAKMTLQGFLSDINRPYVMQMLLDFSFPQSTFPPFECVTTKPHIYALTLFFRCLDDEMAIGRAQIQKMANYKSMQLPADIWAKQIWGITHHAGILTYLHHDVKGTVTYYIPMIYNT
jgi:hypothetical protein